jgi:hypothetical protein
MSGGVVVMTSAELDGMRTEIHQLQQENACWKKVISSPSISLAEVLEESGLSIGILAHIKRADEAEKLVRETDLARTFGKFLFEAIHPSGEEQEERGEQQQFSSSIVATATTRSKFRQVLDDVVGPDAPGKDWKEVEWEIVMAGRVVSLGFSSFEEMAVHNPSYASAQQFCQNYEAAAGDWPLMLSAGYTREQAQVLCTLRSGTVRTAISQAVEDKSPRLALTTHAAYNALAAKASKGEVGPNCYFYLSGRSAGKNTGLADADPRWANITQPDVTGFTGMTTHGNFSLQVL